MIAAVNTKVKDASVQGLISALTTHSIITVLVLIVFFIVRRRFPRTYYPRKALFGAEPAVRAVSSLSDDMLFGTNPFDFVRRVLRATDDQVLETVGLDALMYLRFLRLSATLFVSCVRAIVRACLCAS